MKAIPQYSDFELDYDKFPKYGVGGVTDMNAVNRQDHKDAMFELAEDEWMDEAEQQIKELEELLKESLKRLPVQGKSDLEHKNRIKQALKK